MRTAIRRKVSALALAAGIVSVAAGPWQAGARADYYDFTFLANGNDASKGQDPGIKTLFVRDQNDGQAPFTAPGGRDFIRPVSFTFPNAPRPASDGMLTVSAAGDIGHRVGEMPAAGDEDIVAVYGQIPNQQPKLLGQLFTNTLSNVPLGEAGGFLKNPDGTRSNVIGGPDFHSVTDPNNLLTDTYGNGAKANGMDVPGVDALRISKDDLNALLFFARGTTITLTLFPNPGKTRTGGVGDVKYLTVGLRYEAVPEPSSYLLLGVGLLGLIGRARARRLPFMSRGRRVSP